MLNKTYVNKVAIIIPSHNRNKILHNTLSSLFRVQELCVKNHVLVEIVLIDDSSIIPIQNYPKVLLIRSDIPLGESGAVNLGWESTNARYVVVVSDDDPQPEQWLLNLFNTAKQNPGFGVYYPSTREITNSGELLNIRIAQKYSQEKFQRLLRCPVLAGALIDRHYLVGEAKVTPRIKVDFPSDLIQWLRFSMCTSFFPCPNIYSQWVRSEFQNSNHFKGPTAAKELVKSTFVWSKSETIPLPILLGIIGRIIQFNSLSFRQTINQVLQIIKVIRQDNHIARFIIEIIKTSPYVLIQLTTRSLRAS